MASQLFTVNEDPIRKTATELLHLLPAPRDSWEDFLLVNGRPAVVSEEWHVLRTLWFVS